MTHSPRSFSVVKIDEYEMPAPNPEGIRNLVALAGMCILGILGCLGLAWAVAEVVISGRLQV